MRKSNHLIISKIGKETLPNRGIARDGLEWRVCEDRGGELALLRTFHSHPKSARALLVDVDAATVLDAKMAPSAESIHIEAGRNGDAYRRVDTNLSTSRVRFGADRDICLRPQFRQPFYVFAYERDIDDGGMGRHDRRQNACAERMTRL